MPGIKHGIYHRFTSTHQIMPGYIPGKPRDDEVEASCRLRLIATCERYNVGWTILRPTLIYAEGRDGNVSRLARLFDGSACCL